MYDGNVVAERATVISRIAPCFFRFGSFEVFRPMTGDRAGPSHGNRPLQLQLLRHVIDSYFPVLRERRQSLAQSTVDDPPSATELEVFQAFLRVVTQRSARLVAQWQAAGFVHGVLNTDNMSILGLTIDYVRSLPLLYIRSALSRSPFFLYLFMADFRP
jgi:uncharacterized protein YdiU (UPF0061 family)